jgi:hypothetical protein
MGSGLPSFQFPVVVGVDRGPARGRPFGQTLDPATAPKELGACEEDGEDQHPSKALARRPVRRAE